MSWSDGLALSREDGSDWGSGDQTTPSSAMLRRHMARTGDRGPWQASEPLRPRQPCSEGWLRAIRRLPGCALVTMGWDHDHRADRVEHRGMAYRSEPQLTEAPTSP